MNKEKTLLELRKSRGLTLVSASGKIGISPSALSKLENGIVPITPSMAFKLNKFYGSNIMAEKLPYQQKMFDLKQELALEKEKRLKAEAENKEMKKLLKGFGYIAGKIQTKIKEIDL